MLPLPCFVSFFPLVCLYLVLPMSTSYHLLCLHDSAYAKLGMISSALSSDSDDVTKLLNVSLDLIASDKIMRNDKEKETKSSSIRPAAFSTVSVEGLERDSSNSLSSHHPKHGKGIADSERAVEVLSFLVSKTKVCAITNGQTDRYSTSAFQDTLCAVIVKYSWLTVQKILEFWVFVAFRLLGDYGITSVVLQCCSWRVDV